MKILFAAALVIATGFMGKVENIPMPGAYKMLYQSVKSGNWDTTIHSIHQLKIYTDKHMMYANVNPADSANSNFGIGRYAISKDGVIETTIYTAGGTTENTNPASFNLIITKTAKGYKQVIPDMGDSLHTSLTEEYESVGTGATSPLDGAWKGTRDYSIQGKDTTVNIITEYKTYYAGHVIWGHTFEDAAHKLHTGIGFGKFKLSGNKLKESMRESTYSMVRGHDFDIDIEMKGKDTFTQILRNSDGSRDVQIYQRLK